MHSTLRTLRNLYRNERGGTAIEYGLILALVVLVVLTAIAALGTTVTDVWNGVLTNVIEHTGHA